MRRILRGVFVTVVTTALYAAPGIRGDAFAVVTLDIGEQAGQQGQPVTLPVTMSGGGGAVAGVQLDILYPTAVLSVPNPSAACTLASGQPGSVFTSTPSSPPPPPGMARLRFIVIDFAGGTYADGDLVSCTFQISATAPVACDAVSGDNQGVSDSHGNLLPSTVVDGTVKVCAGLCCPSC